VATDALSAAITNPLSIEVMAAATHPYRVPLREGDPLYPPLSERLPVQGFALCLYRPTQHYRKDRAEGVGDVSMSAPCSSFRRGRVVGALVAVVMVMVQPRGLGAAEKYRWQ
jgi:hypothetical protein